MFKETYSENKLQKLVKNNISRRGWDFSQIQTESQPAPWEYLDLVKTYLTPKDRVLDIGTGGGERLLKLAPFFKTGIGIDIDPEMVKVAKENGQGTTNVTFYEDSHKLEQTPGVFDVILCRHAPFDKDVVSDRLKPRGYFINQEVGEKNMWNIKRVLGQAKTKPRISKRIFEKGNLKLVAFMEYDIEYIVKDIESLVFWLQALEMLHSDLQGNLALSNTRVLNEILKGNIDERGFITNEHRYLVVTQKK